MNETSGFSSVWTQPSPYWLVFEQAASALPEGYSAVSGGHGLSAKQGGKEWSGEWQAALDLLAQRSSHCLSSRAAVIPAAHLPPLADIHRALRPCAEIRTITENLWLVRDMAEGRLDCYMQKVVDRLHQTVGYEAFARMEARDGGVIGGGAIMQAARALHVEYQVDRLLHKQALERFVAQPLDGFIFINFLTGFIQRPEVYLEGLSAAAERHQVKPAAVVLDVPYADYVRDLPKLSSIAAFCHRRGFSLALDDVAEVGTLPKLLQEVRPAFVKLDRHFGQHLPAAKREAALRDVVAMAHHIGARVLAEGVENQAMYDGYFAAGVDMFQGYFIGMPERQTGASAPHPSNP